MIKLSIGVDIGGTNTAFGLVDRTGKIYAQGSIKTQERDDIEDYICDVYKAITSAINTIGEPHEIIGMGIGAPNGNYYNGCVENAANLKWKGKLELVKLFKKHFNMPIFLTNDANAAAMGEMIYGAAQGVKNFIEITLGTGVGSGIVVNGELLYGEDGFAGELGHIIVDPNGRDCGCGRKGCLETYTSATGVVRTATQLLATRNTESELRNIANSELTAFAIAQAANRGDKIAQEVFEITGEILGKAFANFVTFTSPKAFYIFGGLAKAGEMLFNPIRQHMNANMLNMYKKNNIEVLPSQLTDDAAILGASALVVQALDKVK